MLLAFALRFTTPSFGVDSTAVGDTACYVADSSIVQNIVACRLYRSDCGGVGTFYFVREKSTATAHEESLEVDPIPCASYAVTTVNARGLESCRAYTTVGIPPTAVRDDDDDDRPRRKKRRPPRASFDVMGRRMEPVRSGRFFGADTTVLR